MQRAFPGTPGLSFKDGTFPAPAWPGPTAKGSPKKPHFSAFHYAENAMRRQPPQKNGMPQGSKNTPALQTRAGKHVPPHPEGRKTHLISLMRPQAFNKAPPAGKK